MRLHSKYGLNPTIPQCFWCGKDKNEIALLGSAYHGEAPMHMLFNYEPCDNCAAQFARGIVFFEVVHQPLFPNQPIIKEERGIKTYPTGRLTCITDAAVERIFHDPFKSAVLKSRRACIEDEVYEKLFGDVQPTQETNNG